MKVKLKVTIIFPSLADKFIGTGWRLSESPTPPLGPLYIATPLIKAGYKVSFYDLGVDHLDHESYIGILGETDMLLITCLTNGIQNIEQIISDYRLVRPDGYIICGGPHCTETGMHINGSNATVYGDGEEIICDLVECMATGFPPDYLKGISYLRNGEIKRIEGKNFVNDLDSIGPPALELAEGKQYNYIYGFRLEGIVPVITTRGCPSRCRFCTFHSTPYRERSIEDVINEISILHSKGARILTILDDNFMLKKKRVERFARHLIEKKIKLKLIIQGRADVTDPSIYRLLRKAGLTVLMFGTESANQDVLDYYRKGTTLEKIERILQITNRLGIITFSGLMVGAPIETQSHFANNHKFLSRVPLDLLSVNILRFVYPSPLWHEAFEQGKIRQDELIVTSNRKLCNFSYEELRDVQERTLSLFFRSRRRMVRLAYKAALNFGITDTLKLINSARKNIMLRSPEEFHGISISREVVSINQN